MEQGKLGMPLHRNTNPGCLAGFLSFVRGRLGRDTAAEAQVGPLPYRVRDNFLTPAELSFYHVLRSVVGEQAVIQAKVRLADIFFVARPHENQGAHARVSQKHIDFLLCRPDTMQPIAGIELDDASHAREDRQERDDFVNQVFEAASLPLLHMPARQSYHTGALAASLRPYLGNSAHASDAPAATTAPAESQAPLCPKCGIPMVLRTAARGQHQGQRFYGCRNYPDCRVRLPYTAPAIMATSQEKGQG